MSSNHGSASCNRTCTPQPLMMAVQANTLQSVIPSNTRLASSIFPNLEYISTIAAQSSYPHETHFSLNPSLQCLHKPQAPNTMYNYSASPPLSIIPSNTPVAFTHPHSARTPQPSSSKKPHSSLASPQPTSQLTPSPLSLGKPINQTDLRRKISLRHFPKQLSSSLQIYKLTTPPDGNRSIAAHSHSSAMQAFRLTAGRRV